MKLIFLVWVAKDKEPKVYPHRTINFEIHNKLKSPRSKTFLGGYFWQNIHPWVVRLWLARLRRAPGLVTEWAGAITLHTGLRPAVKCEVIGSILSELQQNEIRIKTVHYDFEKPRHLTLSLSHSALRRLSSAWRSRALSSDHSDEWAVTTLQSLPETRGARSSSSSTD